VCFVLFNWLLLFVLILCAARVNVYIDFLFLLYFYFSTLINFNS
jgi:hypothetical protein